MERVVIPPEVFQRKLEERRAEAPKVIWLKKWVHRSPAIIFELAKYRRRCGLV